MLTYIFLFTAASVLVSQGAQLLGELSNPLGVVPDELVLPKKNARRWGERLIGFGSLSLLLGLLSFPYPSLFQYLLPTIIIDGCALAAFALYLILAAPRVQFTDKPADGDHR